MWLNGTTGKQTAKDLTGQPFGLLTVLYRCEDKVYGSGRARPQWMCQCVCGNYKKVPGDQLRNGHTQSCGCLRVKNLIRQRFGKLVVRELYQRVTQPNGAVRIEWLCDCDCGEETIVSTGNLTSGHTTSCGCLVCSAQESVIKHELTELNIKHVKEYTFDDFISNGKKPRPFRFDFALFDNDNNLLALIEYQGSQHFIEKENFKEYGAGQRYYSDKAKKEYCKRKNIPLYEITYLEDTKTKLYEILHTVFGNTVPSSPCGEGVTIIS